MVLQPEGNGIAKGNFGRTNVYIINDDGEFIVIVGEC